MADATVRESPYYSTKVASSSDSNTSYDSFTYISVPRSGNGKIGYTEQDGAEFSSQAGMTMSWSSFEYSADAQVDVSLDTGQTVTSADQVTIRPTSDNFKKELVNDHTVRITVPYNESGYRFSVEFDPQQTTVYNDNSGVSGQLTTSDANGASEVETEPRNSMLIFAQPMLSTAQTAQQVPNTTASNVYSPAQGELTQSELDNLPSTVDTLYFAPGTYYMGSKYRAQLANVRWVYLAPGAYVKGAFKFLSTSQTDFRVTGYGVLSGEQYVYEADTSNGYNHLAPDNSECWSSCVKMLQFQSPQSGPAQALLLDGVTVANPPYHTFVMYGNENGDFKMTVNNYQQVGGWYWQTDGLELYKGSTMTNSFLHSNDDVVKLYHSDVTVNNNVIWKNENGPVFQWGWSPRTISNVHVSNTDIIHNRMYWKDTKTNTCVINSASSYLDGSSTSTGDTTQTIDGLTISNTNVEGLVNCAIRIYAMQNTKNVTIDGLHIGGWNKVDPAGQANLFKAFTDSTGKPVTIGNQTTGHEGLLLHDYTVGGQTILKAGDNWASDELGRLDFDANLWDNWDATGDNEPTGTAPTLAVTGLNDQQTVASRTVDLSGTTNAETLAVTVNGVDVPTSVKNGAFKTALNLTEVSNSIRVVATGSDGVMTVKRYTVYAYGTQIGSLTDPTGDDNGPGSYKYPSDGTFSKGSFDLKTFTVFKDGNTVRFVTTVAGTINNAWGGNGMSAQRLNIYLKDPQAGANTKSRLHSAGTISPLMPGTNMFVDSPWAKAIVVDGRSYDGGYNSGVYDPGSGATDAQPLTLNVLNGNTIVASVPAKELSSIDLAKAGYEVSMYSSSENGEGVGNVRPVYQGDCPTGTATKDCPVTMAYRFVGGLGEQTSTTPYDSVTTDSNAIDIFSDAQSQASLMDLKNKAVVAPFLTLDPVKTDSGTTDAGNGNGNDGNGNVPSSSLNSSGTPSQNGNAKSSTPTGNTGSSNGHNSALELADTGTQVIALVAGSLLLVGAGIVTWKLRRWYM